MYLRCVKPEPKGKEGRAALLLPLSTTDMSTLVCELSAVVYACARTSTAAACLTTSLVAYLPWTEGSRPSQ